MTTTDLHLHITNTPNVVFKKETVSMHGEVRRQAGDETKIETLTNAEAQRIFSRIWQLHMIVSYLGHKNWRHLLTTTLSSLTAMSAIWTINTEDPCIQGMGTLATIVLAFPTSYLLKTTFWLLFQSKENGEQIYQTCHAIAEQAAGYLAQLKANPNLKVTLTAKPSTT